MPTPAEIKAVLAVVSLVADTIREAGPRGIPSGHLYAALMGHMSLNTYTMIISSLKQQGIVKETGHVLYFDEEAFAAGNVSAN